MTLIYTIFFTLVLSVIELFLFSAHFVFLFLFLLLQFVSEEWAVVGAFVAGFIFDVMFIRPFGTTSIIYLILLFLAFLYQRKIQTNNMLFLTFYSFAAFALLEFFNRGLFDGFSAVAYTILTILLARLLFPPTKRYESW